MSSRFPEIKVKEHTITSANKSRALFCVVRVAAPLLTLALFCSCAGNKAQPQQKAQVQIQRPPGVLRVCADPNNLPFSNERGEGFENKIAELLAEDLHEKLEYTWWAQRRGFIRNTLKAGACDVVVGVPASFELAATTAPYYRSSYVFVYRKDKKLSVNSFDDPALRKLKIENVRGYTVYGDYAQPNPPARIIDAVAIGDVDVAVAWGPLAGYFARRERVPLAVVPVSPQIDLPFLPFVFDISMGLRRGDDALRQQLEDFLERRRPEIEKILDEYGVPRVGRDEGGTMKAE